MNKLNVKINEEMINEGIVNDKQTNKEKINKEISTYNIIYEKDNENNMITMTENCTEQEDNDWIGNCEFEWDNESYCEAKNAVRRLKKTIYNMNVIKHKTEETIKDDGVIACDSGAGFSVFKDISLFP